MSLLPGTDGEIRFKQGRDLELEFAASDDVTDEPIDLTGYGFRMQIRESVDAVAPILDCTDYITLDVAHGKAFVLVPGGISSDFDVPRETVDWIADAEFYLIDSNPERVKDAGRYTIHFEPEITR